jgi:hypothetical protein
MTGHPHFNIPAFDRMAALLRSKGHDVVSPAELDDPATRAISMASPNGDIATIESHGKTWGDFLARDVKLLADDGIEGIVVLPGWHESRGARLETFVANRMCGLPIYALNHDEELYEVPSLALYRAWTAAQVYLHAQYRGMVR